MSPEPKVRIDVFSHGIRVYGFDHVVKQRLYYYIDNRLSQYDTVPNGHGGWKRERIRSYCSANHDRTEFRFHRNCLDEILNELSQIRLTVADGEVVVNEIPMYEPVTVDLKSSDPRPFRDYQIPQFDHLIAEGRNKLCNLQAGCGKGFSVRIPVATPIGFRPIGELKVGDEIYGWDGKVSKVTGVFPQGEKEIFKITFRDDRTIECDGEHLWKVYNNHLKMDDPNYGRVINTEELARLLQYNTYKGGRLGIDLVGKVDYPEKDFLIDPYLLGVFLGDGYTDSVSVYIAKPYEELYGPIEESLPDGLQMVEFYDRRKYDKGYVGKRIIVDPNIPKEERHHPVVEGLKKYGLIGKRAWEKFIPEEYFEGSYEQRMELIRGLMDTDGTVSKTGVGRNGRLVPGGSGAFCTTSFELLKGIIRLVQSVGGCARYYEKRPFYTYKGERREGRLAYIVNIRAKNHQEYFKFPRKRDIASPWNQYSERLKLGIISVESTGRKEETVCIKIDHPDELFIAGDYIVTHNTTIALRATDRIGHRLAIVIRPMYIQRWLDDLEAYHSLDRKDIMVVNGSKELMGLMCLAQEGKLEAKVIIISNKTLQRYLKTYASMEDFIYPYRPEEFYQALGVGVRLIDEVHQDFHLNFLQDCYTHVPKTISLSGTMESDNRFDNEMYRLMFPMRSRGPVYNQPPYIQLVNLWYNFGPAAQRLIRYKGHRKQYSHTALEKSIRKFPWLLLKYIEMIIELVGDIFIAEHEHGQKCAIYCATVDMCTRVRDALRLMYPNLKIDKYTQEEPYEVLLGCDIAVTTLQSAGTAVDIPNLKVILSTVALSSKQANEQLIKRLRPLKDWPDVTPTFYFLSAICIPKHSEYANGKRNKLHGKVLGVKEERTEWNL